MLLMAAIFLLFPSFFGIGEVIYSVYAASNTNVSGAAIIKIHKVKAAVDNPDLTFQNTGEEMSQFADNDRINNVEFTIFDVTKYYEEVLLHGMSSKAKTEADKIKDILSATKSQSQAAYYSTSSYFLLKSGVEIQKKGFSALKKTITKRKETFSGKEEDGIANFEVEQATSDGRSKVYLLVETDTSHAINATTNQEETVTKAVNTTICLPIFETSEDGNSVNVKNKIDIYPKNTLERISKRLVPLSGESIHYLDDGIEGNHSFSSGGTTVDSVVTRSVGDIVAFEIMFPVPVDFANTVVNKNGDTEYLYNHLTLRDLPDKGLSFYEVDDFEVGGESIYTYEKNQNHDDGFVGGLRFHADYSRPNRDELKRIEATRADFMIYTPTNITDENTAMLKALAGRTIVLTLLTVVNEEASIETNINNVVGYNKVRNSDVKATQSYKKKSFSNKFQPFKRDFSKNIKNLNGLRRFLNTYRSLDFAECYKEEMKLLICRKDLEMVPLSKNPPPANPENQETLEEDFEVADSDHVVTFEKYFVKVKAGTKEPILTDTAAFVLKSNTYPNEGKFYGGLDDRGLLHWVSVPNASNATTDELLKNSDLEKIYTTEDWDPNGKITGVVDLPGLAKGFYEVIEVKSPAGYYLNPKAKGVSFEVGTDVGTDPENPNAGFGKDKYVKGASDVQHMDKIENFPGGILPNTGLRDTILFLLCGFIVITMSVFLFIKYRKAKDTQEVV
jgi:hypothetical protein